MKTFKEVFESMYGEGSFNDDFLISAEQAQNVANVWAKQFQEPTSLS